LEHLSITMDDFMNALPKVQPSSQREGFTTVPNVTWDDVGALQKIRGELELAIVHPIRYPELYAAVGVSAPGGVLLWGPPGCGKTLLAKAVANESQANFISVRGPELLNKWVGESERAIRQLFLRARASRPCIIFFDEIDALVPQRDDASPNYQSRLVNMLLTELDGLNDRQGVYVIGATNRPDIIDHAMLRPGRLDKALYVDIPSEEDRLSILQTLTGKSPLHQDVDMSHVAALPAIDGFTGADLASLVREAATIALQRTIFIHDPDYFKSLKLDNHRSFPEVSITMHDFHEASSKMAPSVTPEDHQHYAKLGRQFGWKI